MVIDIVRNGLSDDWGSASSTICANFFTTRFSSLQLLKHKNRQRNEWNEVKWLGIRYSRTDNETQKSTTDGQVMKGYKRRSKVLIYFMSKREEIRLVSSAPFPSIPRHQRIARPRPISRSNFLSERHAWTDS